MPAFAAIANHLAWQTGEYLFLLGFAGICLKVRSLCQQQTISSVKYCDSLVNSTVRNVGNTGGAKPTSNYLICNCLFLYVQKLEKF